MKLTQGEKSHIKNQVSKHHGEYTNTIIDMFEVLYNNGNIKGYDTIETLEHKASDENLGGEIPNWLYDVISYEELNNILDNPFPFTWGEEYIELSGEYYDITNIIELVQKGQ